MSKRAGAKPRLFAVLLVLLVEFERMKKAGAINNIPSPLNEAIYGLFLPIKKTAPNTGTAFITELSLISVNPHSSDG